MSSVRSPTRRQTSFARSSTPSAPLGVSFLTPYAPRPIEDKTPIDISHEALIRCWRRINDKPDGWLQKEIREGLGWRLLLFQAESFTNDPTNTLSEPATEFGERQLRSTPRLGPALRGWVAKSRGFGRSQSRALDARG